MPTIDHNKINGQLKSRVKRNSDGTEPRSVKTGDMIRILPNSSGMWARKYIGRVFQAFVDEHESIWVFVPDDYGSVMNILRTECEHVDTLETKDVAESPQEHIIPHSAIEIWDEYAKAALPAVIRTIKHSKLRDGETYDQWVVRTTSDFADAMITERAKRFTQ